jgi:hypothetical protein
VQVTDVEYGLQNDGRVTKTVTFELQTFLSEAKYTGMPGVRSIVTGSSY